jgi:predicted MFS family arabinose efflux permease
MTQPNNHQRFRFQLIAAVMARIVLNTAQRMVYPFLPAFSRGLNVPVESLTAALSLRGALGMIAPLFGSISDRWGRRHAMLTGLGVFSVSWLVVGLFPGYLTLVAAILMTTIAKFIFDPAWQAHLSDRTPYSQRGLVIALTELGWSGSVLVGVPLVGLIIDRALWHSAFTPIAIAGFIAGLGLWLIIPNDRGAAHKNIFGDGGWRVILRNPSVLGALSIGFLISFSNENLNSVYGLWMEDAFKISVVQLGLSTIVIAASELIGEGLVAGFVDRLGKKKSIAIGLALSGIANIILPFASANIAVALAAIFFVYITFEFTIVSTLPLVSGLLPKSRGLMMSVNVASHSAGRMFGALLGTVLLRYGFFWNGVLSTALNVIGVMIVIWVVKENLEG